MEITTSKPAATGDIPTLDRRIADLRRELSLLEAEARAQERQHRADVLRAMKELLLRHGFSPAELTNARPTKNAGNSRQVAPLYRDPATGATWSGRGTEPAWIKGRDRETFKVAG
jgi:DNA-binding protein H-NS